MQMKTRDRPITAAKSQLHRDREITDECRMANFSVEWLSKSYYEEMTPRSKVHREMEEFTKAPRSQCSPTSPNSKFTDQLCLRVNSPSCRCSL